MHETSLEQGFEDIWSFATNLLELGHQDGPMFERQDKFRGMYYAASTLVLVGHRMDVAAKRLEAAIAHAEGQVQGTMQQATLMMTDAAAAGRAQADRHAEAAGRQARQLTLATIFLAVWTAVLGAATCALVYYTRLLTFHGG